MIKIIFSFMGIALVLFFAMPLVMTYTPQNTANDIAAISPASGDDVTTDISQSDDADLIAAELNELSPSAGAQGTTRLNEDFGTLFRGQSPKGFEDPGIAQPTTEASGQLDL